MLRWSLCDNSDTYILVKRTTTIASATAAAPNNANGKVIFKNFAPITSYISIINNIQEDDAQYIDVVMAMYKLIQYSDNFSKTSGVLSQHCRDEATVVDNGAVTDFTEANTITDSFKIKGKKNQVTQATMV